MGIFEVMVLGSNRKRIISSVVVYLYVMVLWLWTGFPHRDELLAPFKNIYYMGLWQAYTIFVPNRFGQNSDSLALVQFEDGTTATWHYPRMDQQPFFLRPAKDRFRKLAIDYLPNEEHAALRTDVVKYVARLYSKNGHRPSLIVLLRRWVKIPPPVLGIGRSRSPI